MYMHQLNRVHYDLNSNFHVKKSARIAEISTKVSFLLHHSVDSHVFLDHITGQRNDVLAFRVSFLYCRCISFIAFLCTVTTV